MGGTAPQYRGRDACAENRAGLQHAAAAEIREITHGILPVSSGANLPAGAADPSREQRAAAERVSLLEAEYRRCQSKNQQAVDITVFFCKVFSLSTCKTVNNLHRTAASS
jgi:hypothetical protein